MVSADALVLFSDIDGLYTSDPRKDGGARHLPEIAEMTAEIEAMAGKAPLGYSSGGMVTKLMAAAVSPWPRVAAWPSPTAARSHALQRADRRHRALQLVPGPRARLCRRARSGSAGSLKTAGSLVARRRRGAPRCCDRARACCRPASPRWPASSERGDVVDGRRIKQAAACWRRGLVAYASRGLRAASPAAQSQPRSKPSCWASAAATRSIHRDDLVVE
jgi:glutamate 5-kinase